MQYTTRNIYGVALVVQCELLTELVINRDTCLPTPFQLPVHGSHVCNKMSPVGSRLSFVWIVDDATLCYANSFVYETSDRYSLFSDKMSEMQKHSPL